MSLKKRCAKGTRRNKKSGKCESYPVVQQAIVAQATSKRCKKGNRRNKKTGECEPYPAVAMPRKPYVPITALHTTLTPRTRNAAIIQRFMKKTKHKRIAAFLNALCSDSGVCIAFGKELQKIKDFFGNFSFDYIKDPIKRIGAVSANGFVNELKFTHKGYSSYAILKSSVKENSDNLMYEYRVGQFLNKMSLQFPCFVETYKVLKYPTNDSWELVRTTKSMEASVFKKHVVPQAYSVKEACTSSKHIAVLIQHLKGVISMEDLVHSNESMNYDFISTLYQIYFVLDCMKGVFTHYDLHGQNVLLYEPSKTKYIAYHYHTPTEVVQFKSIYLAKMIDYGRSYFKDGTYSSKNIYDDVCTEPECNIADKCGSKRGFKWLEPGGDYHIVSSASNKSHDLRLVYYLLDVLQYNGISYSDFFTEVSKNITYDDYYGTKERTCALPTICDVTDMKNVLERYVKSLSDFDRYYPGRTKLGDMHVYSDGRHVEFKESSHF